MKFPEKNKSFCNMCGKKLNKQELLKIKFKALYGSKYDGNTIKFRFCAKCLDLFVDDFLLKRLSKKPETEDCFEWCKKVAPYYPKYQKGDISDENRYDDRFRH